MGRLAMEGPGPLLQQLLPLFRRQRRRERHRRRRTTAEPQGRLRQGRWTHTTAGSMTSRGRWGMLQQLGPGGDRRAGRRCLLEPAVEKAGGGGGVKSALGLLPQWPNVASRGMVLSAQPDLEREVCGGRCRRMPASPCCSQGVSTNAPTRRWHLPVAWQELTSACLHPLVLCWTCLHVCLSAHDLSSRGAGPLRRRWSSTCGPHRQRPRRPRRGPLRRRTRVGGEHGRRRGARRGTRGRTGQRFGAAWVAWVPEASLAAAWRLATWALAGRGAFPK